MCFWAEADVVARAEVTSVSIAAHLRREHKEPSEVRIHLA